MRCGNCGHRVTPDATFCTHCGSKLDTNNQNEGNAGISPKITSIFSLHKKCIIIGLIVVCFIGYFFTIKCRAGFCLLPSCFEGDYCVLHTCQRDSCLNKKATNSNYCYTHSPTTSHGYTYTPESAEDVLEFSDFEITHNSSYTICTGTITNTGRKTYTFVEVKGKFQDSAGIVVDTDWTYAVGSEGLAPGESTTFRLSVEKDRSITKCTMEILDYEKE